MDKVMKYGQNLREKKNELKINQKVNINQKRRFKFSNS